MTEPVHTRLSAHLAGLPDNAATALLRCAALADPPPLHRRIFVNRTLRMETIRYIGFDLDWTLAPYHRKPVQRLIFEWALQRLEERGYPDIVRSAEFRPDFSQRGLLIDKVAGTIVKMDRHRYVGSAYLGRRRLEQEERNRLYRDERIDLSRARFHYVDTLFDLTEVNLFAELVELSREKPEAITPAGYGQLFQDVRDTVDSLHAESTFKNHILSNLPHFLARDAELALALQRLAMNGRKLMLITNSEWYYTNGLCRYLFDGVLPGLDSWRQLFDLVIVEADKPAFFRQNRPFIEIDGEGAERGAVEVPAWGGTYRGGCLDGLMELLACIGEKVLYIGDHIYADIRSTKVTSTWRTALIVSELEEELEWLSKLSTERGHLTALNEEVAKLGKRLDDVRDVLQLVARLAGEGTAAAAPLERVARELRDELGLEHKVLRRRAQALHESIAGQLNPTWGSVFKQGRSKSLFGGQVDDFACVYTSRVSNFAHYGAHHYFRVIADPMAHEIDR